MSNPCDLGCPGVNRSISSNLQEFTYTCANLPDPRFFSLNTYTLQIRTLSVGNRDYQVLARRLNTDQFVPIANFSVGFETPFILDLVTVDPDNYAVSIDPNGVTLIISTKNSSEVTRGVTWRVTALSSNGGFASCLLLYSNCVPPETFPFQQDALVIFSCPGLPQAIMLGLADYRLFLTYTARTTTSGTYQISTELLSGIVPVGTFEYSTLNPFSNPVAAANFSLTVVANTLRISYLSSNGRTVDWVLLPLTNTTFKAIVLISPASVGGMPTPQPDAITPGCPTLFGEVTLTPDEKQICQTDFIVTLFGSPCPDCPCQKRRSFLSQRREYVFYCTDVALVVQGTGCRKGTGSTLEDKASSLQAIGLNVTTAGLATYGMLRLMLSFLLFGRFDLEFLRQSYYRKFMRNLQVSEFCAYAQIFRDSPYWRYFKK